MLNRSLMWKFPLVVLIMYAATRASFVLETLTGDGWSTSFAFATPLLVALFLREKRVIPIGLVMFAGFIVFGLLAALLLDHAQALWELMAERVMPMPVLALILGGPYILIVALVRRLRGPKTESQQTARPS